MLNELLRSMRLAGLTLDEQRAAVEAGAGDLPRGVGRTAVDADGVPCEWITPPGATGERHDRRRCAAVATASGRSPPIAASAACWPT